MPEAEVIVKGEYHSSRGDRVHEREILTEGVDHLVLEGPEEDAKYALFQQWYAFAMLLTEYLFFRVFYTDSSVLEDIAKAQNAEVVKTRESDAAILENSHILVRIFAAVLFLVLFFGASLFGIAGIHLYGVSLLILSAMIPTLILRIHESTRSSESRNELMAGKIADAAEEGGRVVAVVGDSHADEVCDNLPASIDPKREYPEYPWYTWRHFKDIVYPTFVFISVLWVFYTVFVAYSEFAWGLT
jgi:hypothetical protein